MNTLKDLLYDLAMDGLERDETAEELEEEYGKFDSIEELADALADKYLQRFKEENSKYLDWEAK